MSAAGPIVFSWEALADGDALGAEWRELEARADAGFFLSWPWIGTWLAVYGPDARVLRGHRDGRLIALALFVAGRERRHRVLCSRTLHLHHFGDVAHDQIWLEYNGVLCEADQREAVHRALLPYLAAAVPDWDEVISGVVTAETAEWMLAPAFRRRELWTAPTFGVDLAAVRARGGIYLQTLSGNERYQLRRAERRLQEVGHLAVDRPETLDAALARFAAIGDLHRRRWAGESGFDNPYFVAFHEALIKTAWPRHIEIFALTVDDRLVAGLYNFLYRDRVYFYLSGIDYETWAQYKPGLLSHALCIQAHVDAGVAYYDFMGGDMTYKRSLGRRAPDLVLVALQKPRLKFRLEALGAMFKHKVLD